MGPITGSHGWFRDNNEDMSPFDGRLARKLAQLDREGAPDFAEWGVELLCEQLADPAAARLPLGTRALLQESADDYTMALQLDPENAAAYHNRGSLRERLGDLGGAVEDYTEALAHVAPAGERRCACAPCPREPSCPPGTCSSLWRTRTRRYQGIQC